jgi:hypothetical protein
MVAISLARDTIPSLNQAIIQLSIPSLLDNRIPSRNITVFVVHSRLAGSATHGGGSCQFSLSYDGGNTWAVIHSIIGGCPLNSAYTFSVPSGVPSGNALFSWSWFNKVGNRYDSPWKLMV